MVLPARHQGTSHLRWPPRCDLAATSGGSWNRPTEGSLGGRYRITYGNLTKVALHTVSRNRRFLCSCYHSLPVENISKFYLWEFRTTLRTFITVFRWSKSIFLKQRQLLNLITYVLQLYQNNADWRINRYLLSSSGLPAWVYSPGTCPRTRYPNIIQYILSYWDPHQAWLLHQKNNRSEIFNAVSLR